jgi:hypothetical protein
VPLNVVVELARRLLDDRSQQHREPARVRCKVDRPMKFVAERNSPVGVMPALDGLLVLLVPTI